MAIVELTNKVVIKKNVFSLAISLAGMRFLVIKRECGRLGRARFIYKGIGIRERERERERTEEKERVRTRDSVECQN